jgi:hypothetical protein
MTYWSRVTHQEGDSATKRMPVGVWVGASFQILKRAFVATLAGDWVGGY